MSEWTNCPKCEPPKSVPNLATQYLASRGETVADWDGICGELANAVMRPGDDMLYVEGDIPWRFHMAPLMDGLVHDAWCEGDALPPREWLAKMFGSSEVEVSMNGDTIYSGPADKFEEPADPEPCDHDWQIRDDSFDHEFGTEIVVCWECEKCGEQKPYKPGDSNFDP